MIKVMIKNTTICSKFFIKTYQLNIVSTKENFVKVLKHQKLSLKIKSDFLLIGDNQ